MAYTDLRQKSLEDVVNEVQALAAVATDAQVRSIAAVLARCTISLSDGMQSLHDITYTAEMQLVGRLDQLGIQLKSHEMAMTAASKESSEQTKNILAWNKALVIVTGVYTLVSFLLLLATLLKYA